MTIYDFTLTDGKGNEVPLANFKGKVMLIVNTATGCGFTPHYKPIEQMYTIPARAKRASWICRPQTSM